MPENIDMTTSDSSSPRSDLEGSVTPTVSIVPNLASESVQNFMPAKKKFPFLVFVLLVLLAGAASISIYLLYQVRAMSLSNVAPSPTPTPTPTADPTANWNTYINEQYGFSFKYPSKSTDEPNPKTGSKLSLVFHQLTSYQYSELWLYVSDKPVFTHGKNDKWETTLVGGVSATRRAIPAGQNPAQTLIEISYGKDLITLQLIKDDGDDQIESIFDQILSTFKFSDQVKTPAITFPAANSVIKSPITIKGSVPPGWMFEGQFPIEIRSLEGEVIGTGIGKQTKLGDWTSGNDVDFTAMVSFDTSEKSGFIVLLSDNPSGIPEKQLSYKLAVNFN